MDKKQTQFNGFIGKYLRIDLTREKITKEQINKSYSKEFIGGAGYACRELIDMLKDDTGPLSPNNKLFFMTGPFCLSGIPGSGRFVVCSKSPYTNLWGESNCGGFWGPEVKKAGYDGILIEGKAKNPVYIEIYNKNVNIHSADFIWGLNTKEIDNKLKEIYNDSKILSIGQAGENLVKYASIHAEGKTAGRTGMGAVMGSKNLKALVVKGRNLKIKMADPEKFKTLLKKTIKFIINQERTEILKAYGTSAGVITAHALGDLPIKYWSLGKWDKEKVLKISGEKLNENLAKTIACYNCPIRCTRVINLNKNGEIITSEGPEYETIAGFGSLILNDDIESIKLANLLCNKYGLDTISTSSVIGVLYMLFNKNYIKAQHVDDLNLSWGNSESMIKLIKKIAFREGIGNILAEGTQKVLDYFGIEKDIGATINNLEVPYHDIRSCFGMALTYAFSPRGPCHTTADAYKVLRKTNKTDFSSIGVNKVDVHSNSKNLVKSTIKLQDYRAIYSSLILCVFCNPPPKYLLGLYNSILGESLELEDFLDIGERIFNLKRLFNIKMGLSTENDEIPQILLKSTQEGTTKGKSPQFKKLKKYYYRYREWDNETGIPSKRKLEKYNLEKII